MGVATARAAGAEGDHPPCTSTARKGGDTAAAVHLDPCGREGQRPLVRLPVVGGAVPSTTDSLGGPNG
ncbi:MAG: hypothetical protein OEY94_08975 [Alphaproteobacteria bacterium]|nr:hypothetical protein [Alphaproteobacteria bacterium]